MLIKVKVFPKSKKAEVEQKSEDSLLVFVKSEAKENKANFEMLELVSKHLGIGISKIRIVKGSKEPNKIIKIGQ
jgi:uncharacterized protein (TIGR00251 family)